MADGILRLIFISGLMASAFFHGRLYELHNGLSAKEVEQYRKISRDALEAGNKAIELAENTRDALNSCLEAAR